MRPLPLAVREKGTRRTEGAESMIVGIDFAYSKNGDCGKIQTTDER
jgi:hypothetical protein